MAGRYAPFQMSSPANHGPIVTVVTFSLVIIVTLAATIRVALGFQKKRVFGLDDGMLAASTVFALAQSIMIAEAVDAGLGRHIGTLSDSSVDRYYKFSYAANLLALTSMACAKFAVLHLQKRLTGNNSSNDYMNRMYPIVGGSILVWALFSILAIAFQCGATKPEYYQSSRCENGALWYPVTILNALTDVVLAFSFVPVLLSLDMRRERKTKLILLFSIRVAVSVAIIAQIAELAQHLQAVDQTRAMVVPVILQQVVMNLSTFTAVALGLHSFFADLTTVGFAMSIPVREYELSEMSNKGSKGSWRVLSKENNSANSEQHRDKDTPLRRYGSKRRVVDFRPDLVDNNRTSVKHERAVDLGDRSSNGSQEMIIKQTVSWNVTHDEPMFGDEDEPHRVHAR